MKSEIKVGVKTGPNSMTMCTLGEAKDRLWKAYKLVIEANGVTEATKKAWPMLQDRKFFFTTKAKIKKFMAVALELEEELLA